MFQKFFQNTIESKFIQSLLSSTYLPNLKIVSDSDYLIENNLYIADDYIIRCTKTGYFKSADKNKQCEYENVRLFKWALDRNLVNLFTPVTNYYDFQLHKRLGDYLRVIRDSQGVDLMPFYNCFSYYQVDDVRIVNNPGSENNNGIVTIKDSTHKVYAVPIKFNKEYTIAIDSSSEVLLKAGFYDEYGLVSVSGYEKYSWMYQLLNVVEKSPVVRARSFFREPFLYRISNDFSIEGESVTQQELHARMSRDCESQEKNLYLFIQVSIDNDSTVVVLEGDYTDKTKNFSLYTENTAQGNKTQTKLQIVKRIEERELLEEGQYFIFNNVLYKCTRGGIFDSTNLEDERNSYDLFYIGAGKTPDISEWKENRYAYNLTDMLQYKAVTSYTYLANFDSSYLTVLDSDFLNVLGGEDDKYWMLLAQFAKFHKVQSPEEVNNVLLSRSSLLSFNTKEQYAFSDTLIEYLLLSVVDSTETIDKNVSYIQYLLNKNMDGIWDESLRVEMYNRYNEAFLNNRDNNGNLNKQYDRYFSDDFSKYPISNAKWVERGDS